MKNKIELVDNILDTLTDDELFLLINMPTKEMLIEPIKKHPKDFKEEIKGFRIDLKSLEKKLPTIYFKRIRKGDEKLAKILTSYACYVINSINDVIVTESLNDNFFDEIVVNDNILKFNSLVEMILIELKPENLKLYFKLRGHTLSSAQNEYIDKELPLIIEKQIIRKQLMSELKAAYDDKIVEIENNYKVIISTLQSDIEYLKKQCIHKEQDILILTSQMSDEKSMSSKLHFELETTILDLKKEIDVLSLQIQVKSRFLEEQVTINGVLHETLNNRYSEFNKLAYEEWKSVNIKLLQENELLEQSCEELKREAASVKSQITALENIVLSWNNQISCYLENIDKEIIQCTLNRSLLGSSINTKKDINNTKNVNSPYTKESIQCDFVDRCATVQELAENIADNLDVLGATKHADELANYLTGVIASGLVPLICGYNPREIATAVSAAYCGASPYIISLPNGYTNSREVVDLYNHSKANVVLIEDAIGAMNENSLLPLLRERAQSGLPQKLLILSVENVNSVKYMPESLYDYIGLVSVRGLFTSKQAKYIYSDAVTCLNSFIGNVSSDDEYKKMKKLLKSTGLSKAFTMLRAKIITYTKQLSNLEKALNSYCTYELGLMCEFRDMNEQLEKNISTHSMDFKATLFDMIIGDFDE